jgi:hypothetical protein
MTVEMEEFAKKLTRLVRDAAIQSNDGVLHSKTMSPTAKRWKEAAGGKDLTEFAHVLIPEIVDDTVFYLLHAIDEGLIQLHFTATNGRSIDLTKEGEGELAGWYVGRESWRESYSKERYIDVFDGLRDRTR